MNRFGLTYRLTMNEHSITEQQVEKHDFYIQFHRGILYRRTNPFSANGPYSTA